MIYLEKFVLPIEQEDFLIESNLEDFLPGDSWYPCGIFSKVLLKEINFAPVTILYGDNGSGKSTLLNLIAEKLQLNRISPFNKGTLFDKYKGRCRYSMAYDEEGFKCRVPNGSRIITSDDIFDYMLTVRSNNEEISEKKEEAPYYRKELRDRPFQLRSLDDYEEFRMQVLAKKKRSSVRKFIQAYAGEETKLYSNGETALNYFDIRIKNDTLYCLDEPENSLSPTSQIQLKSNLEQWARYCGCQFVIATHSPFLLSIEGARIYDLDACPTDIKKWWELDNTKVYYQFFKEHKKLFER